MHFSQAEVPEPNFYFQMAENGNDFVAHPIRIFFGQPQQDCHFLVIK
jgi:hypothetical protein